MPTQTSATAPSDSGVGVDVAVPRLAELARDGVPRHVVICLFNAMGDAFLALPVIRFVIGTFGRDCVSVWAHEYHGRTVYAELGDIVVASSESNLNSAAEKKESELAALRARLPAGRVLWVSLNPYAPRTAVEDHAIAGLKPQSVWEFRGTHLRVDAPSEPVLHRMDQYFRVIGERPTPPVDRSPLIGIVARQRAMAIRDHVHSMSKRLIAVHAQTRPHKRWPESRWRELAHLLQDECEFVTLGLAAQPLSRANEFLPAPQGWEKQIAILAHADAFIGIDSCLSHVADAFNVAGVVLFGDAVGAPQWAPKGPALKALVAADDNLEGITAEDVAARIRSQLGLRGGVDALESHSLILATQ